MTLVETRHGGYVSIAKVEVISSVPARTLRRWINEGRLTRYVTATGLTVLDINELEPLLTLRKAKSRLPCISPQSE